MDGDVLGLERRRRWSGERKREIVLASFAPGVLVKDVCRRMTFQPVLCLPGAGKRARLR